MTRCMHCSRCASSLQIQTRLRIPLPHGRISYLPAATLAWQPANAATFQSSVATEINLLKAMMQTERDLYMAEIVAQADSAVNYWLSILGITRQAKPKSILLLQIAGRIGEFVAMFYKDVYKRPRPSTICPALQPPFGPPGHPSFPSSHALQGRLFSLCLKEATRPRNPPVGPAIGIPTGPSPYVTQLDWLAYRVAVNRERAGVHYPSDSEAGRCIAEQLFALLTMDTPTTQIFRDTLKAASLEW